MFKKIFLTSLLMLSFNAFGYQDILAGDKIFYDEASATFADKKCENCIELIKKTTNTSEKFSEYYDSNNKLFIALETDYEFIYNGKLIGYSNDELKFYQVDLNGKRLLSKDEVQEIFPEYKIILFSEFDKHRKCKIKNSLFKSKKILILNDRKRTFHNFFVYPESSRNEISKGQKIGQVKSLITVYGKKNVRLKHFGGDEFELVVH